MPELPSDIRGLERLRAQLFAAITQLPDFRRGALNEVYRKCGKSNCACASPGHRGHGPQYNLTRRVAGKTVNTHYKPGPQLEAVKEQVATYQQFADLVEEVSTVSEALCEARAAKAAGTGRRGSGPAPAPADGGEKGGSGTRSATRSRRSSPGK
ncbi:DUF6788 family protein [Acrocarpospora sp. B8E8]|uniref:DUF6788 family protein n=1 Tax=Acrocarpospora sp. B8E8 TaxID=3153572 RepID=UPI00325EA5B3